jgi:hypothetical protein
MPRLLPRCSVRNLEENDRFKPEHDQLKQLRICERKEKLARTAAQEKDIRQQFKGVGSG